MKQAKEAAAEGADYFNVDLYMKYAETIEICLYLYPLFNLLLAVAYSKYKQVARFFYHCEMFYMILHFFIPHSEVLAYSATLTISIFLMINLAFYVDVKLNMASLLV